MTPTRWLLENLVPLGRPQRGRLQEILNYYMNVSRRRAIRHLAVLGAMGVVSRHAWAAEPRLDFPKKAQDRLSVTSYPFRAFIEAPGNAERDRTTPGMDRKDFAATGVEKLTIHHINRLA